MYSHQVKLPALKVLFGKDQNFGKYVCSHTGIQFIQMMLEGAHIEEIYNEPSSVFELDTQSEPESTGLMDELTEMRSRHLGTISKLT